MRIMIRCAVATVIASAALAVTASPADAATGQLILRGQLPDITITNPAPGCGAIFWAGFSEVTNNTNVNITVYTDTACRENGLVVSPGSTMDVGNRQTFLVPS